MGPPLGVRNSFVAEARLTRAATVWYESESRDDLRETVYPVLLSGGMRRTIDQCTAAGLLDAPGATATSVTTVQVRIQDFCDVNM
jgi:hypothetical protein